MRLWLNLFDDQLDVVLDGAQLHTIDKYDASGSATCKAYDQALLNEVTCNSQQDFIDNVFRDDVYFNFHN